MKLITIRSQIQEVAESWREQYPKGRCDPDKESIWKRLNALDKETATAKEVAVIIGNTLWAEKQECDECGQRVDALVEIGAEPNYESNTARVCFKCLRKAVDLEDMKVP